MATSKARWGWLWWLLGYALLALAVWLGYRGVVGGRPAWLAALFVGRHHAASGSQRATVRSTAVAWDLSKVTRVQDLKPGTPADAIIRRFGTPGESGSLRKSTEPNTYDLSADQPWVVARFGPSDGHWVYAKRGHRLDGPCIFLELRDKKLVRVFEGKLGDVDID